MDLALTIFRIGVGVGAVLVGIGLIMVLLALRPLLRDLRALARDAERLSRLAEEHLPRLADATTPQAAQGAEDSSRRAAIGPVQSPDAAEDEQIA